MYFAIQDHGHPDEDRVKAVQAVLFAAGFEAEATCWPVFGGIWPKPCTGRDGPRASSWLQKLTDTMKRGKYEAEVAHVNRMIDEARKENFPDKAEAKNPPWGEGA